MKSDDADITHLVSNIFAQFHKHYRLDKINRQGIMLMATIDVLVVHAKLDKHNRAETTLNLTPEVSPEVRRLTKAWNSICRRSF